MFHLIVNWYTSKYVPFLLLSRREYNRKVREVVEDSLKEDVEAATAAGSKD